MRQYAIPEVYELKRMARAEKTSVLLVQATVHLSNSEKRVAGEYGVMRGTRISLPGIPNHGLIVGDLEDKGIVWKTPRWFGWKRHANLAEALIAASSGT